MDNLNKFFESFVEHMDETLAYDAGFFAREYKIKTNVSQYYLKKAAYNKELCMVKIHNRTYFIHRKYYQKFKAFDRLKHVKVI